MAELVTDFKIKIVVAGSSGVGKTSLIQRYCHNNFIEDIQPTLGIQFERIIKEVDGNNISIHFWDTAGQEKLKAQSKTYYKSADGVLLIYDVTSRDSFEQLDFWYKEIENNAPEDIQKILIANKTDLLEQRQVSLEEGQDWAKQKNLFFMEVSAKTNEEMRVNRAIEELGKRVVISMNDEKLLKKNRESVFKRKTTADIVINRDNFFNAKTQSEKKLEEMEKKKGCC